MLIKHNPQLELGDMPFMEFVYLENHPLYRLNEAIQWDNLVSYLSQFYSPYHGRPTISLRAQAGTEIIKRVKNLSDRDAVHCVEENMYAQRLCNLTPAQATAYMNPANGLANFRRSIGKEGLLFIHEILQAAARKKPLKKGNKLIIDTTCVPLDIHYPTDIRLLERCRQEVIRLIKHAKKLGLQITYRTYNRIARKIFVRFSKQARPKEKTLKKVHKQMLQFVRRNLKQLTDLRPQVTVYLGPIVAISSQTRKLLQRFKESEKRIQIILHQQTQIYHGMLHIPERIVSFHKDHVRPIVRGKFPIPTEFGPKVLVAIVKGWTHVIDIFQHNVADATLVVPALRWFKKTFGYFPKEILADRGFFSRNIVRRLTKLFIRPGLQQRGKNIEHSSSHRRMVRQRLPIEARISLVKRKFGWNRCRARNSDHESAWILLGVAATNVRLSFFCRSP